MFCLGTEPIYNHLVMLADLKDAGGSVFAVMFLHSAESKDILGKLK